MRERESFPCSAGGADAIVVLNPSGWQDHGQQERARRVDPPIIADIGFMGMARDDQVDRRIEPFRDRQNLAGRALQQLLSS